MAKARFRFRIADDGFRFSIGDAALNANQHFIRINVLHADAADILAACRAVEQQRHIAAVKQLGYIRQMRLDVFGFLCGQRETCALFLGGVA